MSNETRSRRHVCLTQSEVYDGLCGGHPAIDADRCAVVV